MALGWLKSASSLDFRGEGGGEEEEGEEEELEELAELLEELEEGEGEREGVVEDAASSSMDDMKEDEAEMSGERDVLLLE